MSTNSYQPGNSQQQNGDLNISDIISFIWRLRYWIILSVVVFVAVAFVYLRLQTPVYQRSSQIMLSNERSGATELTMMSELTGVKQSSSIDNEIFIFRSPSLMSRVVEELGLNTRYYEKRVPHFNAKSSLTRKLFSFKTYEFYKDNPFTMTIEMEPLCPENSLPGGVTVNFSPVDSNHFSLTRVAISRGSGLEEPDMDSRERHLYGKPITLSGFSFTINRTGKLDKGSKLIATWTKPYSMATAFSKKMTAAIENGVTGKMSKTDVITMTLEDTKTARAEDILNTIIRKYNEEYIDYKNETARRSIAFIDTRLQDIAQELGVVESTYRTYQSSRTIVNVEAQSQLTLTSDMQYQNQLTEINLQQRILSMIKDDLRKMGDSYSVIPSNIGLTDASLNSVINNYNMLVAERNRMVANSSENNPRVKNIDLQLKEGRSSIVLSIDNLERVYSIREREINSVLSKSKAKMSQIPAQQFDLTQIERKQQIIEPLYLLLQQKKEESQISMYTVADNARVIEPAHGSSVPVSPKSSQIMIMAFLLGICFPPALVWVIGLLRTSVNTKEDVKKVLPEVPILATLPKSEDQSVLSSSGARDIKSESFRMLRSNLQFIQGSVIQLTSSVPGEGKSYVAANLAASITHIGKKVILVGFDLRKPKLPELFPATKVDRGNSVVSYLIGKINDPAATVSHCESVPGLDLAFSGAVPPNPTELLSTSRIKELIDFYRANYDYVICDSAPMMPVSDSILLNKFVDVTLYVVRSDYTSLKMLPEIRQLFEQSAIVSPKIVLNSMDLDSRSMRYGYGHGYGYGYGYGYGHHYGYGYGYGYGNEQKDKTGLGLRDRIKESFKPGGAKHHHRHHSSSENV